MDNLHALRELATRASDINSSAQARRDYEEANPSVTRFVADTADTMRQLTLSFHDCLEWLEMLQGLALGYKVEGEEILALEIRSKSTRYANSGPRAVVRLRSNGVVHLLPGDDGPPGEISYQELMRLSVELAGWSSLNNRGGYRAERRLPLSLDEPLEDEVRYELSMGTLAAGCRCSSCDKPRQEHVAPQPVALSEADLSALKELNRHVIRVRRGY